MWMEAYAVNARLAICTTPQLTYASFPAIISTAFRVLFLIRHAKAA
jgi:hypothetical protein